MSTLYTSMARPTPKGAFGDRSTGASANPADTTCVILAGGLSTRFGREKASFPWHGKSLLRHVAERMQAVGSRVLAVVREDQCLEGEVVRALDGLVLDNPTAPSGPLRGMVAGLSACRTRFAFVVGCDSPCIQPSLLATLRAAWSPGMLAVVPRWEGRAQPLLALYDTGILTHLIAGVKAGQRSPSRLLEGLRCQWFEESAWRSVDPWGLSFANVNTRQDLRELDVLVSRRTPE